MQKVLQAEKIMPIEEENDYMEIVDVNTDGTLTSADAAFVLQKALDNTYKMPIEKKVAIPTGTTRGSFPTNSTTIIC